jgi:hypothetical protein
MTIILENDTIFKNLLCIFALMQGLNYIATK